MRPEFGRTQYLEADQVRGLRGRREGEKPGIVLLRRRCFHLQRVSSAKGETETRVARRTLNATGVELGFLMVRSCWTSSVNVPGTHGQSGPRLAGWAVGIREGLADVGVDVRRKLSSVGSISTDMLRRGGWYQPAVRSWWRIRSIIISSGGDASVRSRRGGELRKECCRRGCRGLPKGRRGAGEVLGAVWHEAAAIWSPGLAPDGGKVPVGLS